MKEASPNSMFLKLDVGMGATTGILSRTQLWDSISMASGRCWPASRGEDTLKREGLERQETRNKQ